MATKHLLSIPQMAALLLSGSLYAQKDRDQGKMEKVSNPYWNQIEQSLDNHQRPAKKYARFKMQYDGKDLPTSVDEFTTVWCQDPLSQGRTGTCWCFSTSSFMESEIHRLTKQDIKLSELYIVYWEYVEKAREYVRTRGKSFFGEGSEANAVTRMMKLYGMAPASAYEGKKPTLEFHDHEGMYDEMLHYLETLKRDNAWNEEVAVSTIRSILNHYLGAPPEQFLYDGKTYTPLEFMSEVAQLKPNDYVNFMSLMEVPYWQKAEYDVPDNWWNSNDYYNVPLNTFMDLIKSSLKKGYSIAIGGDVSETGYSSTHEVAMIPSYDIPSEYIDDNARQLRFSNGSTTDDHAIHLVGYLEKGDDFWFLVKDSGSGAQNGKNKGYYFYHEDYVKLKMMNVTVHKDAVKDVLRQVN